MNLRTFHKACVLFLILVSMLMPAKMGMGQVPKKLTYFNTVDTSTVGTQGKPASVATYDNGDYIVTFPSDGKVVKYSKGGVKQSEFGTIGSTDGTFQHAWGVALDRDGSIYVSDFMTSRLQKFTPNGTFVWSVNTGNHPRGLAVDVTGNIYVACEGIHCIEKYNAIGQLILTFGNSGPTESLAIDPISVAITADGGVVVASPSTFKIKRYKSDGTYVWSRSTKGQYVWGVTTSWNGNIYASTVSIPSPLFLTQPHTSRIEVFSATGYPIETYESVDGAGRFDVSCGISCSPDGAVVVVDYTKQQVVRYVRSTGKLVLWGPDNTSGQLNPPTGGDYVEFATGIAHGVALNSNGTVICWGKNAEGQCNVPSGLSNVVQVWAMRNSTLALKSDGKVVVWGTTEWGATPGAPYENELGLIRRLTGSFYEYLGIRADGKTSIWFGSDYAVLRDDGPVVQLAAGGWHNIGLRADGTAFAWANNPSLSNVWGQSNVGSYAGISQVLGSHSSTIILFNDGSVIGIGNNGDGRISGLVPLAGSTFISAGYQGQPVLGQNSSGKVLVQNPYPFASGQVPYSASPSLQLHVSEMSGSLVPSPDTVSPTSTFSASPSATWSNSDVTATITSTDNAGGSGVKELHYSVNMGTEQVITGSSATFTLSENGTHSIAYWSVDVAGNTEATNYATVRIDKTRPTVNAYVIGSLVTVVAQDTVSGVAATKVSIDGAAAVDYTGSFTVAPGAHTVTYWATDQAGNESTREVVLVGVSVASIAVSPTTLFSTKAGVGTVKLSLAAPVGGVEVMLESNSPAVSVPVSVTVPAGASAATFPVTANTVSTDTKAVVTASVGGQEVHGTVYILVPFPKTLTVSPTTIIGGDAGIGTVALASNAGVGGQVVNLTSSNVNVVVPATVTVPAGATSATFPVQTSIISTDIAVAISADADGSGITTTVLIKRVAPKSITFAPSSVVGGNSSVATLTVTKPAPAGGIVIDLRSVSSNVSVPATVTIAAGATTATFPVTTVPVKKSESAMIQAYAAGVKVSAVITVTATSVVSVSLNPTTVVGGLNSTATVTLNGVAPVGGTTIQLFSTNVAASVPTSVVVLAGSKTVTFPVTTVAVAANTTASIAAKYLGTTKSAALTIAAPTVSTLTLAPSSLTGGATSKLTIKVSGKAATGGVVVALTSSNTVIAQLPTSVTIPAGSDTIDVTIQTGAVAVTTNVTITAKTGAMAKTAVLTVNK